MRLTVVGVAERCAACRIGRGTSREIFVNSMQTDLNWSAVLVARTAANPEGLADAVKAALRDVDPNVPLSRVSTVDDRDRSFNGPASALHAAARCHSRWPLSCWRRLVSTV